MAGSVTLVLITAASAYWLVGSFVPSLFPSYLLDDEGFVTKGKVKKEYENKYGAKYANLLLGLDKRNDQ